MTLVKICGITNLEDAMAAIDAGADALGFNFYKPSPRYISPEAAGSIVNQLPPRVLSVAVFVNETHSNIRDITTTSRIETLQLHGDESPEFCNELNEYDIIKAFRVGNEFRPEQTLEFDVKSVMLDTSHPRLRGGTGDVFDWAIAAPVSGMVRELFLAGGLSPENVANAIDQVRPFAVDACSSLERVPGRKDQLRVAEFVAAVRNVKP